MIWRRWVTESSSSVPQTSSDHLRRRLSNTRMSPPQSGFVQVGFWEVCRSQSLRFLPSDGQTGSCVSDGPDLIARRARSSQSYHISGVLRFALPAHVLLVQDDVLAGN